jgi:hypothetical protein
MNTNNKNKESKLTSYSPERTATKKYKGDLVVWNKETQRYDYY